MTVKLIGADDATIDAHYLASYIALTKFTAVATGTCSEIRIKVDGNGNVKLSVYADNGSGTAPGARLAKQDNTSAVTTGWNTIALEASCSLVSGTVYWLGSNS